jgi:hypothetical protein
MLSPPEIEKLNYLVRTHPPTAVIQEVLKPLFEADRLEDAHYALELASAGLPSYKRSYLWNRLPGMILNNYLLPRLQDDRVALNQAVKDYIDKRVPIRYVATWPDEARAYLKKLLEG